MKRGSLLTLKMLHDNLFIICYQYIYFYLFFKMKLISLHSESNHLKTYMTVYIKDFCPPFINVLCRLSATRWHSWFTFRLMLADLQTVVTFQKLHICKTAMTLILSFYDLLTNE